MSTSDCAINSNSGRNIHEKYMIIYRDLKMYTFFTLFVFVLRRKYFQWNQPLRTHWGSWLQLLMAWDTGASLNTKSHTYLKYLVSWLRIAAVFVMYSLSCLYTINLTDCTLSSATLDSAVTLGHHGAKNFLMRDGKEVVQCVFYENVRIKHLLLRRCWALTLLSNCSLLNMCVMILMHFGYIVTVLVNYLECVCKYTEQSLLTEFVLVRFTY